MFSRDKRGVEGLEGVEGGAATGGGFGGGRDGEVRMEGCATCAMPGCAGLSAREGMIWERSIKDSEVERYVNRVIFSNEICDDCWRRCGVISALWL